MDWKRLERIVSDIVHASWSKDQRPMVGLNISPLASIKVAFDGYAKHDDDSDDEKSLSFAIYIHKHSSDPDFVFPEHEQLFGSVVHRPEEEAYLNVWYDLNPEDWSVTGLEEIECFTEDELMVELEKIHKCI